MLICVLGCLLPWSPDSKAEEPNDETEQVALVNAAGIGIPIMFAESATDEVKVAAEELAGMLERITGASFQTTTKPRTGAAIVVGTVAEFPELVDRGAFPEDEPQAYLLRTSTEPNRVLLIGADDQAVGYAVWDFLGRLGYRQYFPGDTWEIVPNLENPTVSLDVVEAPDYKWRQIFYTFGVWDYNRQPYTDWMKRNRMGGVRIDSSHVYEVIYLHRKAVFDKHPEYLALTKGKRGERAGMVDIKFCISNPGLRELVVDWALEQFEKSPERNSLPMDPSDGGGWCQCEKCAEMGSVSDRVVLLANQVAEAVERQFGPRRIGIYAYNEHASPPSVRVHPNITVSVATAFLPSGADPMDFMRRWGEQGATLGVRDYFSYYPWDADMPGRSKAANPEKLAESLRDAYELGARYMIAEAGDNWGPYGLGYYVAARTLWDVKVADDTDAILERFITDCFPGAEEKMTAFYQAITGWNPAATLVESDHRLGAMYALLRQAHERAEREAVRRRVADLILYTRYVEIHRNVLAAVREWPEAPSNTPDVRLNAEAADAATDGLLADIISELGTGDKLAVPDEPVEAVGDLSRSEAFERMIRWAYRIRKSMMVHTRGMYRDLDYRSTKKYVPENARWDVPEPENPWKSSEPVSSAEIEAILREGIARNPLFEIEAPSYSLHLRPGGFDPGFHNGVIRGTRGKNVLALWTDDGRLPDVRIRMGRTATDAAGVWHLMAVDETILAQGEIPMDLEFHVPELPRVEPGAYLLKTDDKWAYTALEWNPKDYVNIVSDGGRNSFNCAGSASLWFFVPKGTRNIVLYGGFQPTQFRSSTGKALYALEGTLNYHSIPVPDGEDGRPWRMDGWWTTLQAVNIPPYFALSAESLLIPEMQTDRGLPE